MCQKYTINPEFVDTTTPAEGSWCLFTIDMTHSEWYFSADTQRNNNAIMTSKRRRNVVLTS